MPDHIIVPRLVFLWACVCQCVTLRWGSVNGEPSTQDHVPPALPWVMHIGILGLTLWPVRKCAIVDLEL